MRTLPPHLLALDTSFMPGHASRAFLFAAFACAALACLHPGTGSLELPPQNGRSNISVHLAGGRFRMGTDSVELAALLRKYPKLPSELFAAETPALDVVLAPFDLDAAAVTVKSFAACGGQPGDTFPWGARAPTADLVNWSGSNIGKPISVAQYPPNSFGLYDMSGNVWEFTSDRGRDSHALVDSAAVAAPADILAQKPSLRWLADARHLHASPVAESSAAQRVPGNGGITRKSWCLT